MNDIFLIPDCRVGRVTPAGPAGICVAAQGVQPEAACPNCSTPSRAVHSWYRRHPADLPSLGQEVRLDLRVRRFYCRNLHCPRRTFTERLPDLLAPRARRTRRLAAAQGRIGVACGGQAGARVLHGLAMPVSGDTVLRLVRAMPLPEIGAIRALGVDDGALKKGQTYGTILIDLIARRAVDLLPDRTASSLEAWLRGRGTISVIARDRSTEYARGAAKGAPGATQVADRWHLLANLREMIARWLSGIHGRLRRLPAVPGTVSPARRTRAYPRSRAEAAATADYRARRLAVYEEVRRRFDAGEKLLAISRTMGLARGTVRRYAYAESFPERAVRVPPPGILDPWLDHLEARLAAGCEDGMALWRGLRDLGFAGTPKQVHRWLSTRRTAPAKRTPHKWRSTGPDAGSTRPSDAAPVLLPPRQLAWLLVQFPEALDASQTATLARIAQDAEVAGVVALVRRFADLVRTCGIDRAKAPADPAAVFASWLVDAQACGVRAVETFAAGLRQDEAAIKAALTLPWSSGQAEGQINKLKLIKRQMYGRARFDLIRRRVLLAA